MLIIDFKRNGREALRFGFAKGVCAPLMLFGNFEAPIAKPIDPIRLPDASSKQALENDWITIGNDFRKVIDQYGQKKSNITQS